MSDPQTEKRRKFIINVVYFVLIAAIVIFTVRYGLKAILPFVFGLVVSMILQPIIRFFTKKCHLKKKFATVLSLVLFYCTIGVLLAFICVELAATATELIANIPDYYANTVAPALENFAFNLEHTLKNWFPDLTTTIDDTIAEFSGSLGSTLTTLSKSLLGTAANMAGKLPRMLLNTLIAIISSFFISLDYFDITHFLLRQMNSRARSLVIRVKNELGSTLIKYLKSYSLILGWTFIELIVGLSIMKVPNAGLISLVIAVFDILPVIGSGLFLLPWTVVSFIIGDIGRGIGLLVLYLIITIVRNIIEPRIVGEQVGLPAIVTLMAMVVGTYLFGGIGLLGLPVALAIIKSLNDQGVINLYRDVADTNANDGPKGDFFTRLLQNLKKNAEKNKQLMQQKKQ